MSRRGVVIAANRLPVAWDDTEGEWTTSPGGLVTALRPILHKRPGKWVGWDGTADRSGPPFDFDGIHQVPVALSEEDLEDYYEGFCNGTVWPLYHDAIRPVEIHRTWWRAYEKVNQRFAEAVTAATGPNDLVWVHDYQLQLVPALVREKLHDSRIGFFLHIPFPPPEIFARLPWRTELVGGLLGADVIGFHTRLAMLNFAESARQFGGARGSAEALMSGGRRVRLETAPISIDAGEFENLAHSPETHQLISRFKDDLGRPRAIVLGVDRLDYTKGIDLRLRAFETLLDRRPDLLGEVTLVQVAVPSREGVGEYQIIKERVEQLVGQVNGRFGQPGWTPVHYLYRGLERSELVAYYRAAAVMLITPLRDGMNLVAKEYIASRVDRTGVLVLSEFAGAAEQLDQALIVNPYDIDGLATAIERAIEMPADEQQRRMTALRRTVRRWDVHAWAERFIAALEG